MLKTQKDVDKTTDDGRYTIGDGLSLRVTKGRKYYVLRVQLDGERKDFSLGSADRVSLATAKARARTKRAEIAEKGFVRRVPAHERAPLFLDAYPVALAALNEVRQWQGRRHEQLTRVVANHAARGLGGMRMDAITAEDVERVLRPIWYDLPPTARLVQNVLERIFDYSARQGWCEKNPAAWQGGLEFSLPAIGRVHAGGHFEAISMQEAKQLAWRLWQSRRTINAVLLFTLLTVCRSSEARQAEWSEISGDVWTCPAEKTKTGVAYRFPLSRQAQALLWRLPKKGELIFPSHFTGRPYLQAPCLAALKRLTRPEATVHGLRSTFRDWCAETGADYVLAEKSLMHAVGGATQRAYQRSDQLEQRRRLMQRWSDTLLPNVC